MLWMVIVYDDIFIHCICIIVWEKKGDVLHCLGGDRGWTPLRTKLAGVSRVKVPKSYICMGASFLGCDSVKWQNISVGVMNVLNCEPLSCILILVDWIIMNLVNGFTINE